MIFTSLTELGAIELAAELAGGLMRAQGQPKDIAEAPKKMRLPTSPASIELLECQNGGIAKRRQPLGLPGKIRVACAFIRASSVGSATAGGTSRNR